MADLQFQDFNVAQSNLNKGPATIASAATIAPQTRFSIVTGTVAVATITPPLTGYHEIVLMFNNAAPGAFPLTGNIGKAATPVQNQPVTLSYNPIDGKYYPGPL